MSASVSVEKRSMGGGRIQTLDRPSRVWTAVRAPWMARGLGGVASVARPSPRRSRASPPGASGDPPVGLDDTHAIPVAGVCRGGYAVRAGRRARAPGAPCGTHPVPSAAPHANVGRTLTAAPARHPARQSERQPPAPGHLRLGTRPMSFLILLASLGIVTLGAEVLVRSASIVALRAGVSALFVGLTIVGFGTSSPELSASLVATLNGNMGVSIGNVVGSNIFNVAFILALTAIVKPIRVGLSAVRRDLGVAIGGSFLLLLPAALGGVIPRWLGAMMFARPRRLPRDRVPERPAGAAERPGARRARGALVALARGAGAQGPRAGTTRRPTHCGVIVGGLALLVMGAKWFVGSAITIAQGYGVPEDVIGLTIVSVGTSLPELVTSIVAARRGNPDIAVGNVIGSSIFNLLGIAGLSAMVAPQVVSPEMLRIDIPLMILAMLALIPIMRTGHSISRGEGVGPAPGLLRVPHLPARRAHRLIGYRRDPSNRRHGDTEIRGSRTRTRTRTSNRRHGGTEIRGSRTRTRENNRGHGDTEDRERGPEALQVPGDRERQRMTRSPSARASSLAVVRRSGSPAGPLFLFLLPLVSVPPCLLLLVLG